MRRVILDARSPDPQEIEALAAHVRSGGVVALPTDTLYGLAADPQSAAAVAKVFAIKGRPADRGLPLIAADLEQVIGWTGAMPELARRLALRFWPGPLTLLLPAPPGVTALVTSDTGNIAIRVPAHAVARALCAACGYPLTATSANRSGEAATADPEQVVLGLGTVLDVLADAGPAPGGEPSTIVDATGEQPRLVRAGAIPWETITEWLRRE